MAGPPPVPVLCKILGTVIRTNATSFKANYGDGTYAGTFRGVSQAQRFIEQSISPGGAPMTWVLEDRIDFLEAYHVGVLCVPTPPPVPPMSPPPGGAAPMRAFVAGPVSAPGIFGIGSTEDLFARINPAFALKLNGGLLGAAPTPVP